MSTTNSEPISIPKYTISQATEADLPALVAIQFKVFSFFAPEVLANGSDTPANHAKVIETHRRDMHNESGLRIAKVELLPEVVPTTTNLPSPASFKDATATELQPASKEGEKVGRNIIGFCMFCLPNEDADTPTGRIPRSIRPRPLPITAPFIDDPIRRVQVEKHITGIYTSVQPVVANKSCAWVRYMAVLPAYQRLGIGKALMSWGCQLFDAHGVNAALLASEQGIGLYRQFGFRAVSPAYFEIDDDGQTPAHVLKTAVMWRDAMLENESQEVK